MTDTTTETDTTTVLVIGNHYYGSGPDIAAAKKEFQRQGGLLSHGYEVITFGPEATFKGVDSLGRYYWEPMGYEPTITAIQPRKGTRR